MSVYVILEFDSDEEAKTLVKDVVQYEVVPDTRDHLENYPLSGLSVKVVSVVKKPTKFCHCIKKTGWTRGKNYGWWVCATCKLPTQLWASRANWDQFMGLNLLPQEISGETRSKGLERSPFTWDFLLPKTPQGAEDGS